MAEYIERAAAVKAVLQMRRPENSVAQNRMLSIIQMDMLKLPAADVAPVVRCKDCKNCRKLNRENRIEEAYADDVLWCTNQSDGVCPDDFCSYGERKGGETDGS